MVKYYNPVLLLSVMLLVAACAGQKDAVLLRPDPAQAQSPEQTGPHESWQIIDSQNGAGETEIPVWVRYYLDGNIQGIESMDAYRNKYVFIGDNRGDNFNALQQWANGFAITQDLPRLIVHRVEQRLIASATLYPDDEYGEYFANMIKKVSDGEYPEAVKEQTFWIKKQIKIINREEAEIPPAETDFERYEFFIFVSIDKEALQKNIREIMTDIKTTVSPTRKQTTSITRINETFFEEF